MAGLTSRRALVWTARVSPNSCVLSCDPIAFWSRGMALPVRVGISLPVPPDVDATLKMAEWAEASGFDGVWFAGGGDADALTLCAAVAMRTKRVRIGVAVVPVYSRTPVVFASTLLALSHVAPNRFVLGLGASSHLMIEGWHGVPLEKPL